MHFPLLQTLSNPLISPGVISVLASNWNPAGCNKCGDVSAPGFQKSFWETSNWKWATQTEGTLKKKKKKATGWKRPRIPTMAEISQISDRTWVWDIPLPTEEWLFPLWSSCYKCICTYSREPKSQLRLSHSFTRTHPQMHTPIQYTHTCSQSPWLVVGGTNTSNCRLP